MSAPQSVTENHPWALQAQQRWYDLKSERSRHERIWESIAQLIRPQRGGFMLDDHTTRIPVRPLSSAPIIAQTNFAAGLYGTLTNPANRWMAFQTDDDQLNNWKPARDWLWTVSTIVLRSLLPATSTFYSAAIQVFSDLSSFGNGAQYDEVVLEERKILDITLSLAEVCYDIDGFGRVCEVVRKFGVKPGAALAMFKNDALPPKIQDLAEKDPQAKIYFYHHIVRNDDWRKGMLGVQGKRWASRYVCEVDNSLVRVRGFDEMPFHGPRWEVESGEIYGTGPAFVALASARTYNRMEEATIRAAQRASDPSILAPDRRDWPLNGKLRPGAVVYGGLNVNGQQMVRAFDSSMNVNLTLEEKQAKIEEIKDAFHYTLMTLAGRTGMTATEVMTINEERLRLWAPHMGRVQEEYLAPKLSRRFSLLWRAGQIPPPPKEMQGRSLQVMYLSAAAMAQKSAEGTAIVRVLQDLEPLAQAKPRLLDRIDDDGLFDALIEARGAPASIVRSREDADKIEANRSQQEQIQQAMQMAQAGSGTAKNLAEIQQMGQQSQNGGGKQ